MKKAKSGSREKNDLTLRGARQRDPGRCLRQTGQALTEYVVFLFVLVAILIAVGNSVKSFVKPIVTQQLEQFGANLASAVHTFPFRP